MSDSEGEELMSRVFVVQNKTNEFDLDLPPLSGQEYLLRVQKEARTVPAVVVAKIDSNVAIKKQTVSVRHCKSTILPAPHCYRTPKEVQDRQAAHFSRVRQNFVNYKSRIKREGRKSSIRLPLKEDVEHWCRLCFGRYHTSTNRKANSTVTSNKHISSSFDKSMEDSSRDMEEEEDQSESEGNSTVDGASGGVCERPVCDYGEHGKPPLLSIVVYMDQPTVVKVLEYHVNWFEATGFTPEQGRWFYALMAAVEKPLVPEASFLLRGLARNCANLRATLPSAEDPLLPHLNLLITLVVKYFDQRDLEENG